MYGLQISHDRDSGRMNVPLYRQPLLTQIARISTVGCIVVALISAPIRVDSQVLQPDQELREKEAVAYVNAHADKEDMVMIPMRDGVQLYNLIEFPKDHPRQNLPAVLIHIPYLIDPNHTSELFAPFIQSFLQHGYAIVWQSERGRYFSRGHYTYLVRSGEDGFDTIDWITKQPWSNGKVGALGCSSSAEEQHKLNAFHPPGFAAAVPWGSGAGIGRIGPYNEMGNMYRGGVLILNWIQWWYSSSGGNPTRPLFDPTLSREDMINVHRSWNLQPEIPVDPETVNAAYKTLPLNQIMKVIHSQPSDFDSFVNRFPNDPRWKDTEFGTQDDHYSAPMLMINSWYDMGIGPNVTMFEYQVKHAATETARNDSRMIIAPTLHCQQTRASEHTIVSERDVGDARFDYVGLVQDWYDHFLKGMDNGVTKQPLVRAYMMGINQWRTYDSWPPKEAQGVTYYLDSDGGANTRLGNGRLTTVKPGKLAADHFTYDPMTPVPTPGGAPKWAPGGSYDRSGLEMRSDVLVYSTPPLAHAVEITGPITVTLYLSSDRKDTDLTVELLDVDPSGRAYNLDESIQRVRWREGWDHPVFMQPGQVYKVEFTPLTTSNAFAAGHQIRIEVSSSDFPHFERNLNTGGNNYDEKDPLVAHNVIHHGPQYPSSVVLPVISAPATANVGAGEFAPKN